MLAELKKLKYHILASILMPLIIFGGVFLMSREIGRAQETAGDSGSNEALIANLNKQIEAQQEKIDKLAEEINKHKDSIKKAQGQAANFKNQVYILDNQIAKMGLDITAKEEEIKSTELEIEKIGLKIKENELMINKDKERLAAFIRALDHYDDKNYLFVLLSNNSFSEFFDQVKALENIEGDLQKTLNRVQELVETLNKQKEKLNGERDQLSDLLNKLEQEKTALGEQKGAKQYLIVETKKSEVKFQNLITDLKKEQTAANNQIAALERKIRQELEKKGSQEKFNSLGEAALIWPINNPRITCYFHDPDYPFRNLFEHSGIDLAAKIGTPVKAAESGYVAKVAANTRWYGTYVMIIHNNNLSTLYGHLSSINVKGDQYVTKGQIIGYSGNTGFSTGPHLHFEVRSNGIPVSPSTYLP
ncbi:MAG: peptidoglycan DD-metalloendopeptidase family protein [Patescibacteria group bacterium]